MEKITNFNEILKNDCEITNVTKKGYCRLWTKRAAELARDFFEPNEWEIMAREITTMRSGDHTFLRIRNLNDEQLSFFYDGTGTGEFEPYCGLENESPPHLKKNTNPTRAARQLKKRLLRYIISNDKFYFI